MPDILHSALVDDRPVGAAFEPSKVDSIPYRHGIESETLQPQHIVMQQTDLTDGAYACFYVAAFKSCADAYPLTAEERVRAVAAFKSGWDKLRNDGKFIPGTGGYVADGVHYAVEEWNFTFPDKPVKAWRFVVPTFNGQEATEDELCFYRAKERGWTLVIGRGSSDAIKADLLDDGIIQGNAKPSGTGVYWHLCNYFGMGSQDDQVADNYPKWQGRLIDGKPWDNVYGFPDIAEKRANGQVLPSAWCILPA